MQKTTFLVQKIGKSFLKRQISILRQEFESSKENDEKFANFYKSVAKIPIAFAFWPELFVNCHLKEAEVRKIDEERN